MVSFRLIVSWMAFSQVCHAFVDFGDLTKVRGTPTVSIPRPHQLPEEWQIRYRAPQHPMITAVAPFLTIDSNGTHQISWSTTYHQYSRHFQNARGILKRQNGVFQSDASLLATCTSCSGSGSGGSQNATDVCYSATNTGILGGPVAAYTGNLCYGASYGGALQPVTTSTGLPCCPSCTPVTNGTGTISGGVLVPTGSTNDTTTITVVTSTTVTVAPGPSTVTVVNQTSTLPPVTITKSTIFPDNSTSVGTPVVTTALGTVIGCGTASGSGTVIGSGTVYLGPGGIFPVTSSGTVSGYASKVIGCGTIIATNGGFQGTATVIGCGTATGCAVLTGIGTVYPDALGGLVGITSSGVASGCGKVVGCGTLIGTGSFQMSQPYTTTITPTSAIPTVNVYISYCPPDPLSPFRIAANLTARPSGLPHAPQTYNNGTLPPYALANSTSAPRLLNGTNMNSTADLTNPLCQICPNDSGICCPLFSACGADGHCPHVALLGAGYIRFGVNVVDKANSSDDIGMIAVQGRLAPGLKALGLGGNTSAVDLDGDGDKLVRRHGHLHGRRRSGRGLRAGRFRWP